MSISTVLMPDGADTFLAKGVPITDVTLAELIAGAEPIAHARELDQFYRWDGSVWTEVHENEIAAHVINVSVAQWIRDLQDQGALYHMACTGSGHTPDCLAASNSVKSMKRYLGSGNITNLVRALKRNSTVSKSFEDFDSEPYRVNFRNGVWDALSNEWFTHHPSFYMTKQVKSNYHPGYTHPDWDKALNAMSMMDEDTKKWVQMYLGTGLTGLRLKNSLTTFFVGNGSNGKSTILDTVVAILGSYAGSVPKDSITGSDQEAAIARLNFKGLRLAVLDETKAGARLDTDAIKTISGVTITARKLHVGNVTYKATHTFLIATNHEPYVKEMDEGIWRRLVKIPFKRTFKYTDPDFDPGLFDRLQEGTDGRAEAVTAWLIEGARMYFAASENLLPLPAELVAATEEWAGENDIIGDFIATECEITGVETDRVSNGDLFDKFNTWATMRGHAVDYKQTGFIRSFKNHRKVATKMETEIKVTTKGKERAFSGIKFGF